MAKFEGMRATRFSGNGESLHYWHQPRTGWRFVIVSGDDASIVGSIYATKEELLSDLNRYATEYGFVSPSVPWVEVNAETAYGLTKPVGFAVRVF